MMLIKSDKFESVLGTILLFSFPSLSSSISIFTESSLFVPYKERAIYIIQMLDTNYQLNNYAKDLDNMYFLPNNRADTSGFMILDSSRLVISTIACAGDFSIEPATSSSTF